MDQIKTGNFLKELRKAKNITQEELANHLNVSRKSVSRWETGTNMPDLDILIELSKFYDVNIDEILNGQKRENNEVNIDETVSNVAAISDNTQILSKEECIYYLSLDLLRQPSSCISI